MLRALGLTLHILLHLRRKLGGHDPPVFIQIRRTLQPGHQRCHEGTLPRRPTDGFFLLSRREHLDRPFLGVIFRRQSPLQRERLRRGHIPTTKIGIKHHEDVFRGRSPTELFELIQRNGFGGIVELRVPRDHKARILGLSILRQPGVAGKKEHDTVLSPDLTRQIIVENVEETSGGRLLVLDFDDLIKPEPSQRLRDRVRAFERSHTWRDEIVLDADDDGPRFIVQPLRFPDLGNRVISGDSGNAQGGQAGDHRGTLRDLGERISRMIQ